MFKNLVFTALLGAFAVLLGAFGSHGLKETLPPEALESFNIGVRYHAYYVLLLFILNIYNGFSPQQKRVLSIIFFLGILFFSGSIYLIQLTPITAKSIWFITPLGGVLFVAGWLLMAWYFYKNSKSPEIPK